MHVLFPHNITRDGYFAGECEGVDRGEEWKWYSGHFVDMRAGSDHSVDGIKNYDDLYGIMK